MSRFRLIALSLLGSAALVGYVRPVFAANAGSEPARIEKISPDWPSQKPFEIDAELRTLHDQLGITPAQDAQWDVFAQRVRAASARFHQTVADLAKSDPGLRGFLTYQELQRARLAVYDEVNPSYGQLYAVLSPNQQRAFNDLILGPRTVTCGLLCRAGIAE
jgi:periplasmic protein CpxP/Spy